VDIEVLEEVQYYSSEWDFCSPTFVVPKKNEKTKVVTDFRKLNLLLKRRMPHISYSKDWEC
jgi:hypothetical protein